MLYKLNADEALVAERANGAMVQAPEYFSGTPQGEALRFSDGSRVVFSPATDARVQRIGADGVDLTLERGSAHLRVVHRNAQTHWMLAAGPYRVHVVGTEFDTTWEPQVRRLTVAMQEGRVHVTGPGLDRQFLNAGQTLTVWQNEGRVELRANGDEPPASSRAAASADSAAPRIEERAATASTSTSEEASSLPEATAPDPAAREPAAAERRPGGGAVERAERPDVASAGAAEPSSPDARIAPSAPRAPDTARAMLSEARARQRRGEDARSLYEGLRRRFPTSPEAASAAFYLARLSRGATSRRWLETYVREAPAGPYASAAWGRLLRIRRASGHAAGAAEAARAYLRLAPSGPYSEEARAVLAGE